MVDVDCWCIGIVCIGSVCLDWIVWYLLWNFSNNSCFSYLFCLFWGRWYNCWRIIVLSGICVLSVMISCCVLVVMVIIFYWCLWWFCYFGVEMLVDVVMVIVYYLVCFEEFCLFVFLFLWLLAFFVVCCGDVCLGSGIFGVM